MPAIQGSQLAQMAKMNFKSKSIKLPMNFAGLPPKAPFDASDQKVPDAAAVFTASSTLSYHVDTAKTIGKNVEDLIDAVCDAIGKGFGQWQSSAKFTNVLINGPVGMAMPGSIVGAPAMSGGLLFASVNAGGKQADFSKHAKSICMAIGNSFTAWVSAYMVQLMYPPAAVQSCTMVPAPNIPMPVVAGNSPAEAMLAPAALKGMMLAQHGKPGNHTADIFDAVAQAFNTLFTQWKASTMINQVLGVGGVAPPPPSPPGPVAAALGNVGMLQ